MQQFQTKKQAVIFSGTLSNTSKMGCKSWGIAALENCKTGRALSKIAGSVCANCYACKGQYQFKNVKQAHSVRKDKTLQPEWVPAMIKMIEKEKFFRWHDSGDLYSYAYLLKIVAIVKATPETSHWIPTKEHKHIKKYLREFGALPENVIVRVSSAMIDAVPILVQKGINTSTVTTDGAHSCPAYKQGGECKTCRACWDKSVPNISYPKH